jgi:Fic family protein
VSGQEPAGTYARHILNRFLIELSWNSSRLEGNTYSLLDTKRLIEFGQEAEGRDRLEAQMILNHKDAVEFLVGNAAEAGFNRYTILNLHAILANNLLADERATGRLRHIGVGIELLATAAAITDPFEQSFFVMVQLPYLQPFDDVNKRVSRMAANIPFIRANLSPLSFTDLPRGLYAHAERYAAVRQSLGEPDPFRLRHRDALRAVVAEVVLGRMDRKTAAAHIASWATAHLEESDRAAFREVAETELLGLHEGNFARETERTYRLPRRSVSTSIAASSAIAPPRSSAPFTAGRFM